MDELTYRQFGFNFRYFTRIVHKAHVTAQLILRIASLNAAFLIRAFTVIVRPMIVNIIHESTLRVCCA